MPSAPVSVDGASAALITSFAVGAYAAPMTAKPDEQQLAAKQARAEARAEAKAARDAAKDARALARSEAKAARQAAREAAKLARAEAKAARKAEKAEEQAERETPETIGSTESLTLQGSVTGLEGDDLGYSWSSTCLTDEQLTDSKVITSDPGTAFLVIGPDILTPETTCEFTLTVADADAGAEGSATVMVEVEALS